MAGSAAPEGTGPADSYSRLERLALEPFRRAAALAFHPVLVALAWLRVPPSALSLAQIPLGFAAAALLVPAPRVAFGLILVTLYVLDVLDGMLARFTGRASPFGALMDQVSDHVREITVVGGLVAAGALRGEIGVAYALAYPLVNSLLYLANRYGAPVPVAIKTWMVFYPFLFLYLWSGPNWLDCSAGAATGLMVVTCTVALVRLRHRMFTRRP